MLPVALLLCVWWRRGRFRRRTARSLPVRPAPAGAMVWVQRNHKAIAVEKIVRPEGAASRVAAAAWIVWFYLCKVLLPANEWSFTRAGRQRLERARLPARVAGRRHGWLWMRRKSWAERLCSRCRTLSSCCCPFFSDRGHVVDGDFAPVADHLQNIAMIASSRSPPASWRGSRGRRRAAPLARSPRPGAFSSWQPDWARAALYGNDHHMWQDTSIRNPWRGWPAETTLAGPGTARQRRRSDQGLQPRDPLEPNPGPALGNPRGVYAMLGKFDLAPEDSNRAIASMPNVSRLRVIAGKFSSRRIVWATRSATMTKRSASTRTLPKRTPPRAGLAGIEGVRQGLGGREDVPQPGRRAGSRFRSSADRGEGASKQME